MILRKLIILFTVLITCIGSASAAMTIGDWKLYVPFNGVDMIIATPDKYYFTSDGALFSYDTAEEETRTYSTRDLLNDKTVGKIFYNREGRYLVVTYTNGNIDLLYDDGKVVNMADIRDAQIPDSKRINHITFGNDRIYVATDFGIVIFDDKKHHVVESGIFNIPVKVFTRLGNHYIIGCKERFLTLPADSRISSLDKFKEISYSINTSIQPFGDNRLIGCFEVYDKETRIYDYHFNFEENTVDIKLLGEMESVCRINPTADGYSISSSTRLMNFDNDGNLVDNIDCDLYPAAYWKKPETIMATTDGGIASFTKEGSDWQQSSGVINPGSITTKSVDIMKFDRRGNLYISSKAYSRYSQEGPATTPVNRLTTDRTVENLEPVNLTFPMDIIPDDGKLCNTQDLLLHPSVDGLFYISSFTDGLRKIRDNKVEATYNSTNSPMVKWWGSTAMGMDFDKHGNLWVTLNYDSDNTLYFIEADKADNPGINDWKPIELSGFKNDNDTQLYYCRRSGVIVITTSRYRSPIVFYDTKGTSTVADDVHSVISGFIDQDGRNFFNIRHSAVFEDENGKIWIGTDDGVIVVGNPKALASNPSTPVTRVKVPRNDGTNLADYLLSGHLIRAIDADNARNRWFATDDGVYVASPDGTEIRDHFTTENSPLPTNEIRSLACDPYSNSIFIGTPDGMVEYNSSASPAADNYSNIIAYPNPVEPNYSGPITIKGLMDNSLVKIADSTGNVVFTTRSEGGMATWDGCNYAGQRVRTGVYYVFASSSSDNSSTTGAVTKIMIIR